MQVQLELYRTFQAVARAGSISVASRSLAISQPAVSQAVRQLEHQLDAQLFVRHAKGVSLTREGTALLVYVEQALRLFSAAESHFDQLRELSVGQLRIAASDTLCKHWLLPHLERFHHAHPGIGIQVTNRTSSATMALLRRGEADIGVVNLPLEMEGEYEVHEIARVQDCFVYAPRFFPDMPKQVTWQALSQMPLIMLERASATRRSMDQLAEAHGVTLAPEIELGSLDLLSEFAISGLGISAVVAEFVQPLLSEGLLKRVPLIPAIPTRAIAMVFHREVPLPACARAFIEGLHLPD